MRNLKSITSLLLILIFHSHSYSLQEIYLRDLSETNLNYGYFRKYNNSNKVQKLEIVDSVIPNIAKDAFDIFPNLVSLIVRNSMLRNVNFTVKSIKYLDLSENVLRKAPNLEDFPNLISLNLNHNLIRMINYESSKEHHLESLDLSENPLQVVNVSLNHLRDLTIKNVDNSEVEFSINCTSLNTLDLRNVEIKGEVFDSVCLNNNATIFMNFGNSFRTYECLVNNDYTGTSEEPFLYEDVGDFQYFPKVFIDTKPQDSISVNLEQNQTGINTFIDNFLHNDPRKILISIGTSIIVIVMFIMLVIVAIMAKSKTMKYKYLDSIRI